MRTSQFSKAIMEPTESTVALKEATSQLKEAHKYLHSLENISLEDTLRDTELHYKMELEMYSNVIQQLEVESTWLTANIQKKKQEYEAPEAEITTYRQRLDGDEFEYERQGETGERPRCGHEHPLAAVPRCACSRSIEIT
ncbi:Keratin, type I cytoskeletal 18-like [Arapaima gigas]